MYVLHPISQAATMPEVSSVQEQMFFMMASLYY